MVTLGEMEATQTVEAKRQVGELAPKRRCRGNRAGQLYGPLHRTNIETLVTMDMVGPEYLNSKDCE